MFSTVVWPLLIYWLVMFVLSYVIIEVAQDQLYDEVTPRVGLKVALGSFILAVFLTWIHPTFETMFTANIAWTALQGIVWFGVFTLIYQFHPQHAAAIGILTMLIVPGVASMGVDSIMKPTPASARVSPRNFSQPVRKSLGPVPKQESPAAKSR